MAALNNFFQKVPEIKIRHYLVIAKLDGTPTFCKRNFAQMHQIEIMNFLSFLPTIDYLKPWLKTSQSLT